MKKLLFKIASFVLIAFYIFSPITTWAQGTQSAAQRLQQQRLQDQQQCLERPKSQNSATTDGTISNLLANAFRENLSRGINNFFSHELGPLVQKKIDKVMPTLIQNGLARRLPSYVEDATYRRHGNNAPSVEELRAITEEGIKIITADVIRQETPNITDYVLSHDFPQYIEDSFSTTTSDVITSPEFVQKVREAVDVMDAQLRLAQADQYLKITKLAYDMARNFPALLRSTKQSITQVPPDYFAVLDAGNSVKDTVKALEEMAKDAQKMVLTSEQKDLMVDTIIEEMAAAGKEAVRNDSSILELVDSISSRVSSAVDMTVVDSFIDDLGSLFSRNDFDGAINDNINDGTLSAGGIDFTGPNGDLTGGLAGSILVPMVNDMALPIATWTAGFTNGLVSSGSFDFAGAVGNNPGTTMMVRGTTGSGSSAWAPVSSLDLPGSSLNPADVRILNSSTGRWETPASGDFVGPPSSDAIQAPPALNGEGPLLASAENIGDAAATQGAANAATKISASAVFQGMGQAFLGAIPGMVGGLVGSLASNIPVVGGLVAPIAALAVQTAVTSLLFGTQAAMTALRLGFMVTDIGLGINVGMGFDAMGKAIGEVIKNTGKSNANEEQANKYLTSIQATNLQACTYEKSTNRIALFLEELFGIRITDSHKASFFALNQFLNGPMRKTMSSGYNVVSKSVPGSADGQNGQSMIADPEENVARDQEDARNNFVAEKAGGGNWIEQGLVSTLERYNAAQYSGNDSQTKLTKQEYQDLLDPAKRTEMAKNDPQKLWDKVLAFNEPGGNRDSALFLALGQQEAREAQAANVAKLRYTTNDGVNDSRVCVEKNDDGSCHKYKTLASGSLIADLWKRLVASPVDYGAAGVYNGDALAKVGAEQMAGAFNAAQPTATNPATQNITDLSKYPCPGPGPCSPSDHQISVKGLSNDIDESVNDAFGASSSLYDDSNSFGDLSLSAPVVIKSFTVGNDQTTLSWETENAIGCSPVNDWLGTDYKAGDFLADDGTGQGQVALDLPASYEQFTYKISCTGGIGSADTPDSEAVLPAKTQ